MTATDEIQLKTEEKAYLVPPRRWPPTRGNEARQLRVLSKQDTGDRHHLAPGIGAHTSNYQRGPEEGACCELPFSAPKERRPGAARKIQGDENSQSHDCSEPGAKRDEASRDNDVE